MILTSKCGNHHPKRSFNDRRLLAALVFMLTRPRGLHEAWAAVGGGLLMLLLRQETWLQAWRTVAQGGDVLRGLQFSCRFGMRFEDRTLLLCRRMAGEFETLSPERFAGEWMKLALKGKVFDNLFTDIVAPGLGSVYPELAVMVGVPQEREFHPVGNCDVHVAYVMNAARAICDRENLQGDARATLMLAALCHDIGKPVTTQQIEKEGVLRWASHGHEAAGGAMTRALLQRIGIKREIVSKVVPLLEHHLAVIRYHNSNAAPRLSEVRKLALDVSPASLQELGWLMESDHSGRPPLPAGLPQVMEPVLALAKADGCFLTKPTKSLRAGASCPIISAWAVGTSARQCLRPISRRSQASSARMKRASAG